MNGIFQSGDNGDSWIRKSVEGISEVQFMYWFGRIYVHPENPYHVYVTSLNMFESRNAGNSWERIFRGAHVDHHALYIHPQNPSFILNGNDGGINLSFDKGESHTDLDGINNIQFYACSIHPNNPDVIFGGAQDNGTWKNEGDAYQWNRVFGGDGFRTIANPINDDTIYVKAQYGQIFKTHNGGNIFQPATFGISGSFNWNAPLTIDPDNPAVLYSGTQALFRTEDHAESWTQISPTLITEEYPPSNVTFGTLSSIDVSSLNTDIIYIGSDDGGAWVTKDKGENYTFISEDLPRRWVTKIAHDPWNESGVYITISGFRFSDSDSHVYYSDDYGNKWESIGSSLPDVPVNDIIIDDEIHGNLYVATDIGVFVSENFGEEWTVLGTGIPVVPVLDLDYHAQARLLAAASYGKGIFSYNLPDITSTEEKEISSPFVFYPNPTTGNLNISTSEIISSIEIFDTNGKFLIREASAHKLDVSFLEEGIYYIKVHTKTKEFNSKFIKI